MTLATDPPVSEAQRKAMFAAASGHSTLGIPKSVGEEYVGKAKDNSPGALKHALRGFMKWLMEEEAEPEHEADDENKAHDPATGKFAAAGEEGPPAKVKPEEEKASANTRSTEHPENLQTVRTAERPAALKKEQGTHGNLPTGEKLYAGAHDALAFDKSVRNFDVDGRLHVDLTPISKANICEYRGDEIPDFEKLGLDPTKMYRLLRDPEELKKAASTFNRLPLLSKHVPVDIDNRHSELEVGYLGSDADFDGTYLNNSLVISDKDALKEVLTGKKKQLSSAYRYRPDMNPGQYKGEEYDGVMRDIIGNHVALVETGRAGSDVVVGDESPMSTTPNSGSPLPVKEKKMENSAESLMADKAKDSEKPDLRSWLSGKLSAEDMATYDSMCPPAKDSESKEAEKDAAGEEVQGAAKMEDNTPPAGKAMDEALDKIREDIRKEAREAAEAREFVAPWVGKISLALDTAPKIYEAALKALNVDIAGVDPSAFKAVLTHVPNPNAARKREVIAEDASNTSGFMKRWGTTAAAIPVLS